MEDVANTLEVTSSSCAQARSTTTQRETLFAVEGETARESEDGVAREDGRRGGVWSKDGSNGDGDSNERWKSAEARGEGELARERDRDDMDEIQRDLSVFSFSATSLPMLSDRYAQGTI